MKSIKISTLKMRRVNENAVFLIKNTNRITSHYEVVEAVEDEEYGWFSNVPQKTFYEYEEAEEHFNALVSAMINADME